MPASGPPPWGPDDTGAIPVGPEPEPTGAAGRGEGPGGWGGKPTVEPFAVAALVWAIVSIVLPLVGTIVALVLSARAADAIRRSRGTRSGGQLVTAARIIAGAVIALWAIGLVAFVALGGNDDNNDTVAVPTQPPSTTAVTTSLPPTTTTQPPTTTLPPSTTTTATTPPTIVTVAPPPTEPPTTQAPPTTAPPTSAPPTIPTSTTLPATTTTTSPQQALEKRLEARLGPSNRGVPSAERVVTAYTPGSTVTITWAINNGTGTLPVGTPTCGPVTSTTTTTSTSTTSSTTSTTTSSTSTTTTTSPDEPTVVQARAEARQILQVVRNEIRAGRIDVSGVQLIGTYPIEGPSTSDVDVVQVFYSKDSLAARLPSAQKVFDAPPATEVQCLNPAFA